MGKFAWVLIVAGILCVGYFGYQYLMATQSVEEYKPENTNTADKAPQTSSGKRSVEKTKDKKIMSDEIEREKGSEVATLKIPKLNNQFTTYWGADEDTLDQGVGMYISEWTVTPGYDGNVVLSGHRDTVFTGLGELADGDILELDYDDKSYKYEIDKTWITDADDRSVIVDKDDPTLTLTTCYPFDFIGYAPDRYIVQAKLKE